MMGVKQENDRSAQQQRATEAPPSAPSLPELLATIQALREEVRQTGAATLQLWAEVLEHSDFQAAASNLAHYLALRRHDLSAIQRALSAYGLSSLGRSETHVMSTLDRLIDVLLRLSGASLPPMASPDLESDGERALLAEQERIFGPDSDGLRTRIMVTLPREAAFDADFVRQLLDSGMNCARINCAHDSEPVWRSMIAQVRQVAQASGRTCRILMDIAGPKCRIESLVGDGKTRLYRGDRIALIKRALAVDGAKLAATISFPEIIDLLEPGAQVWINDGKIGARIMESAEGYVLAEIFHARAKGERLRLEKGVNFPQTALHLPPLTEGDLRALDCVAECADLVGFSFVQRPSDIVFLGKELARRGGGRAKPALVLKIETPLAVRNLPQLIVQGRSTQPLAVMIARGDLAVELGFARLSEIQEEILWLCEAAHVPVIWATQVLENMIKEGAPTRAETTDAAMAQRAECVMLNKGPFLVAAVAFLRDVLHRMDRHQAKKSARFGPLQSWHDLALTE
jgi:pyruvate kinase